MFVRDSPKAEGNVSAHETPAAPIPPPHFDATSTTILSTTRELIDASERLHETIARTVDPAAATFDNTVLPIIHEENKLLYERQLVEFLASVSPSEDIRQVASTAKRLFTEFDVRTSTRQDLYDLILAVSSRAESLDLESRRLLDRLLSDFGRQGLGASQKHQQRLREIETELSDIETDYLHHLQPTADLDIQVAKKELEGVPQRFLSASRDAPGSDDDIVRINVGGRMQLLDLLSYVKSHKAREKIYREYVGHHQSNATLFERAMLLRHEKAQILGYATYTEWSMAARMEKDPHKIATFLQDLSTIIRPTKDSIVEQWRLMKKGDLKALGEPDDDCFYVWDRPYYTKRMMEHKFTFDSDTVKEYFPLEHTASCMLGIFGNLFRLRFVNIDGRPGLSPPADKKILPIVWHEDVSLFAVWDGPDGDQEDDGFLGYLYMDLYRRPGKRLGFADLPIRPVRIYFVIKRVNCKRLTITRDSFGKMDRAHSLQQDWCAILTSLRRVNRAS
jgi:metallopeptidase MepB